MAPLLGNLVNGPVAGKSRLRLGRTVGTFRDKQHDLRAPEPLRKALSGPVRCPNNGFQVERFRAERERSLLWGHVFV